MSFNRKGVIKLNVSAAWWCWCLGRSIFLSWHNQTQASQAGESDQAKQAVQGQLHSVFTIQGCSVPRSSRDALLTNQRAPGAGSDQSEALIVFCLRLSAVAGRPLGCLAWTGHQH